MHKLVFFDLETGGLDPKKHQITQIAAIAVDKSNLKVVEQFEVKIKICEKMCDPDALKINSYNKDVWDKDAVNDMVARNMLNNFFEKHATVEKVSKSGYTYKTCELAGHNIANFDIPFLQEFFKGAYCHGAIFTGGYIDTLQLAKLYEIFTQTRFSSYKLFNLVNDFVKCDNNMAHDALVDVIATVRLYAILIKGISMKHHTSVDIDEGVILSQWLKDQE